MSRKQERELREVRAIMGVVDGALENWGIEMHRGEDIPGYDDREPSERFAAQIGDDEAVEYEEVYALICDIGLELYNRGREVVDVPMLAEYRPLRAEIDDLPFDRTIPVSEESWKREHEHYEGGWDYSVLSHRKPRPVVVEWTDPTETPTETMVRFNQETHEAWAEVARLKNIIERAYGTEGWDIGAVKNILLPGLDGYHQTLLTRQEKCGHNDTRVNRQGFVECNDCGRVWGKVPDDSFERAQAELAQFTNQTQHFHANNWMLGFGEGSSRDGWWIELELYHQDDDKTDDAIVKAVLTLTDQDAIVLAERIEERVREGRKDWNQ